MHHVELCAGGVSAGLLPFQGRAAVQTLLPPGLQFFHTHGDASPIVVVPREIVGLVFRDSKHDDQLAAPWGGNF
jgi:hypothetical protein